MNRRPDWEARLAALVAKADKPYSFGHHDCLIFPANAVKAITGHDYARGHRGKYKSPATAQRYLKQAFGVESPEALLDTLFPQKPVGFAGRGDLVLASDGIPALCLGAFAISVGQEGEREGLVRVPRAEWVKAWAVGEHHSGDGGRHV